jgi:hypothetical protein
MPLNNFYTVHVAYIENDFAVNNPAERLLNRVLKLQEMGYGIYCASVTKPTLDQLMSCEPLERLNDLIHSKFKNIFVEKDSSLLMLFPEEDAELTCVIDGQR